MNPFTQQEPTRIAIVDGDVLVHKISRAAENKVRFPDGQWIWTATEEDTRFIFDQYVDNIKEEASVDELIMCLSSDTNFRHDVYDKYKFSRRDPEAYGPIMDKYIRQYMRDNFETFEIDGLEADDVIGILMTSRYKADATKILMTIDKDLDTIPGIHWNLDKREFYDVSQYDADYFFHEQILTGDRVDDIPGCPGYGPKTAQKLLNAHDKDKWWEEIVSAYRRKGFDEDYALMNARLVRILTINEYTNKEINLWQPLKQRKASQEATS